MPAKRVIDLDSVVAGERSYHALSRVTVPSLGARHFLRPGNAFKFGDDVSGIWHETVCAFGNRDGSLRIRTYRQTGNSERRSFLLEASGVRHDRERVFDQVQHFQITDRLEQVDAIEFQPRLGEALPRAWVRREHHISLEGNFAEHARESADPFWIVDVRRSVQSNYNR